MRFLHVAAVLALGTLAAVPGILGEQTPESRRQEQIVNNEITADRKLNGVFQGGRYYPDLDSSSEWDSDEDEYDWDSSEDEDFDEMTGLGRKKGHKKYGKYGKKHGKKWRKKNKKWRKRPKRKYDEDEYDWESSDSMDMEDWELLDSMEDWDSDEDEYDWVSSEDEDFDELTGLGRKKGCKKGYKFNRKCYWSKRGHKKYKKCSWQCVKKKGKKYDVDEYDWDS